MNGDSSVVAIPWGEFLGTGIRHREMEKKLMVTGKKQKKLLNQEDGHVDAVEEGGSEFCLLYGM